MLMFWKRRFYVRVNFCHITDYVRFKVIYSRYSRIMGDYKNFVQYGYLSDYNDRHGFCWIDIFCFTIACNYLNSFVCNIFGSNIKRNPVPLFWNRAFCYFNFSFSSFSKSILIPFSPAVLSTHKLSESTAKDTSSSFLLM